MIYRYPHHWTWSAKSSNALVTMHCFDYLLILCELLAKSLFCMILKCSITVQWHFLLSMFQWYLLFINISHNQHRPHFELCLLQLYFYATWSWIKTFELITNFSWVEKFYLIKDHNYYSVELFWQLLRCIFKYK